MRKEKIISMWDYYIPLHDDELENFDEMNDFGKTKMTKIYSRSRNFEYVNAWGRS